MRIIDKIGWLHIVDRKFLMLRSHGKDMFYFPGGKREEGESDLDALSRELGEELGIALVRDTAFLYGVFQAEAHGQSEPAQVKLALYEGDWAGTMQPQSEIAEMSWFDSRDAVMLTSLARQVAASLKAEGLID